MVKFASDVTGAMKRDAEFRAMSENVRRFATLSDATDNWFWETDEDDRFIHLSDNFERINGEHPDEYLGKKPSALVAPHDEDPDARRLGESIARRELFKDLEYRRTAADGRRIWVRVSGAPKFGSDGRFLGYLGAGSDITEQRSFRERRDQLASLLDQVPIGLMLLDKDLNIQLLNQYLRDIFEGRYDNIGVGSRYRDLIEASVRVGDVPVSLSDMARYAGDRIQAIVSGPTEIERARDEKVVEIRSSPLDDGSILLFEIDATVRRELRDQLIHSQRLDAIGQITAGVAHDFNNLLAIILGSLELISEDFGDGEAAELIETALSATRRGAALTEQLLAFGRHASLTPKVVDIDEIILGIRDLLRRTLPENIQLDLRLSEARKFVDLDPRQFEQAILNLVINARDAIASSGAITVSTELREAPLTGARPGDGAGDAAEEVVIAVADDGHGIAAVDVDKVFEPFYSTKAFGKGSGLGLSMVHGFVSQSGGRIVLESETGKGTIVTMGFPASMKPEDENEEADRPAAPHRGDGRLILLVEDNDDVRHVMRSHLEGFGYDVVEANDGQAALLRLAENAAIELMLTDFVMPGELQGGGLIAEARLVRPDLKAIMMTGYAEKTAFDIEASDFEILLKPVMRAQLEAALDRAMGAAGD